MENLNEEISKHVMCLTTLLETRDGLTRKNLVKLSNDLRNVVQKLHDHLEELYEEKSASRRLALAKLITDNGFNTRDLGDLNGKMFRKNGSGVLEEVNAGNTNLKLDCRHFSDDEF